MPHNDELKTGYSFPQKVWIAGSIIALIVVVLMILKATFSVLLLVLAGVLIAVFFRGLSGPVQRKTGWKPGWSLAASFTITLLLLAGLMWLVGAKVQSQIAELSDTLPSTIDKVKQELSSSSLGQKLVTNISSPQAQEKAKAMASTLFKSTFGVLGDVYVVLFLGIFFTVSPQLYVNGITALVPPKGRQKAADVLGKLGAGLKKWLKGKLFAMLIVFALTAVSLVIIGVPMWLTLAIIAGILNFIPNFGPLLAMVPAVLVGFMQGPVTAAIIAGLYIVVQVVESNFITPKIQQRLINIPPALIIIAQLLMGVLTGGWGLLLATPLMLILIIVIQQTYIKQMEEE